MQLAKLPKTNEMKTHYRRVKRLGKIFNEELSITVPCGANANITRDTTKDESKVTCSRCLKWLKNNSKTKNNLKEPEKRNVL